MAALRILVPSVQVRILAFQHYNTTMNTEKTIRGLSFFGRTTSLGEAQRANTSKARIHPQADEFIGKMWLSPEERKKLIDKG